MGESTTRTRPYTVLQKHESLADLVDDVLERAGLDLEDEATAKVQTAIADYQPAVFVLVREGLVARDGLRARRRAAKDMRVDEPTVVEIAAIPERNWSQAPVTLAPGETQVSE